MDLESVEPESVTEHSTRERTDVGNYSDPESAIRKCAQKARCLVCLVIREIQSCEGGGKMAFPNFLVAVNRRSLRVALDVRKVNGHPEVGDLDVSVRERSAVGVHALHDTRGKLLNGLALRTVVFVVLRAEPLRPLQPFRLAVDDFRGVISNVKCAVLLKDVPSLVSPRSALQTALWMGDYAAFTQLIFGSQQASCSS